MNLSVGRSCHLVVDAVSKFYPANGGGVWALRGLSLCVRQGEFVCVVGPSGCGKTTLLSIVAGFEAPSEGAVYLGGEPVTKPGPDRGVIFQEDALFPWYTVLGNVCYGLYRKGMRRAEAELEAMRFLELVRLEDFASYYPHQLSGGMKQRAALARVMAARPDALLMDEPFGALDALTRMEMQQLLLRVWRELRPTILFVTHDVDEALFLADRIYVMTARPGRIYREFEVPLPRPRNQEIRTTGHFADLKQQLLKSLFEAQGEP